MNQSYIPVIMQKKKILLVFLIKKWLLIPCCIVVVSLHKVLQGKDVQHSASTFLFGSQ